MPISLSTTEVVKQYPLDDGSIMTVVAQQFDGPKARSFDARMNAGVSVPDIGTVEVHPKSPLFRAGIAAALSLKECSLTDPASGERILKPTPEIDRFLDIWFHPALTEVALTHEDRSYTYCDLVADAVYEVNPQIDPFPSREKPPTSGGPQSED